MSAALGALGRLLVVSPNAGSPFVDRDVRELRRHFEVEHLVYDECHGKAGFLARVGRRLAAGDVQAILLWFLAPAYSVETIALAHLFGRRVAVVVAGLEVDYVPELQLGGLKWPHNRLRQRLGLRTADLVLSPSAFLTQRIRRVAEPRSLETIYNGVDVEQFSPGGAKEDLAVSVCFEINRAAVAVKGLPVLLDAARSLPAVSFVVVGRAGRDDALEQLRAQAPDNVSFTGRHVTDDELLDLYRRAKVYVQVSAHEAFGVAMAEAMACGCIPVIANGHALSEVAGPIARRVPYGAPDATAAAIESALAADDAARESARERIVTRYPLSRRIDRLETLLRPLVARSG